MQQKIQEIPWVSLDFLPECSLYSIINFNIICIVFNEINVLAENHIYNKGIGMS